MYWKCTIAHARTTYERRRRITAGHTSTTRVATNRCTEWRVMRSGRGGAEHRHTHTHADIGHWPPGAARGAHTHVNNPHSWRVDDAQHSYTHNTCTRKRWLDTVRIRARAAAPVNRPCRAPCGRRMASMGGYTGGARAGAHVRMVFLPYFVRYTGELLNNFRENYLNSSAICQGEFRKDLAMPETRSGYGRRCRRRCACSPQGGAAIVRMVEWNQLFYCYILFEKLWVGNDSQQM